MSLSQESVDQMKTAYYEAYGKLLSDEEAWSLGYRLLEYVDLLTRQSNSQPQPYEPSKA